MESLNDLLQARSSQSRTPTEEDHGGRVGGAWAAGGETCTGRGVLGDRQLEREAWTGLAPGAASM